MQNIVNENFPDISKIDRYSSKENVVKSRWPEFYKHLMENYPSYLKFSEKMYWYYHKITETPKCKTCGSPVNYSNFSKGYYTYCCLSCAQKDRDVQNKKIATNLERFGVPNASQNPEIQKKIQDTCERKYGARHALQNKEILEKSQNTCEQHYGVKCPGSSKEIMTKVINTQIEKYGGVGTSSKIIKEKIKQTNLNKYGSEWGFGSEKIRNKSIQTWKEKYGVDNPFASEEIKEQLKISCLEKYGVDNYAKSENFKKDIQEGQQERSQKSIQTCREKYGVDYYSQTTEYKDHLREISSLIKEKEYKTRKKNHTFNTSKIEQEFKKWLDNNNIEYKYQYKSTDYPYNCDFYFPKTNYYLEIQGMWMHGFHPYDENNLEDRQTLQNMMNKSIEHRSYLTAIKTWTISDVNKRKFAKDNKLNWTEVFTIKLDEIINHCRDLNIF